MLKQLALEDLRQELDEMTARVRQVMKQTRARIFRGNTRSEGKLLSLFEPSTEVIRKGKAGKPNEFGKMVKLQEAENQIITDYEVYARRPNDSDLLVTAIETHQALLGRTPRLVAADAAFYSVKNEAAAKAKGVKRVCIPNRSTRSSERKREQRKRWFRNGQKWRTGCEGRISVVKRRHGLDRCRYKGYVGMNRWVGLGVIADNVLNIGRAMQKQRRPLSPYGHLQAHRPRRSPRRGLRCREHWTTMLQNSILRREVARDGPSGRASVIIGCAGPYGADCFAMARPMLMRLSAITPSPTQRFMPSSPLYRQRLRPCRRLTTLMRPSQPVRHFWPWRNHRFFCSRLRSELLVERLGMHTRLTPLAFAAASFLAE